MSNDINLLDCTLRDGGYINNWNWGYECAKDIIYYLIKSKVDIVEVGFLRDVESYDQDITVCNRIEELNKLLPDNSGNTMFSAMAMCSNYDISKLSPYSGKGIAILRITAHEYDIYDGIEYARKVKELGYKVSFNPINIMGYSDEDILHLLQKINEIDPYQFAIVDTFGSMKRRDLDRIVRLADNNLNRNIRLALHLHENMSMSFCLAQNFIDYHLNRPITIDASLMGIGRTPGNLPIELIADYMNDYVDKTYDMDFMMDAIQNYITPLKGESTWGYTPAYFLSAHFNLHRNYVEYYLGKGDLTNRDIHHILSRYDRTKVSTFDSVYAEQMYNEYNDNDIDDSIDRAILKEVLCNKEILVLAPGSTLLTHKNEIDTFIKQVRPIVISVNFIPDFWKTDYVFYGNSKRCIKTENINCKTIVTSNLHVEKADYVVNYNSLASAFNGGCNGMIMLLKLLKDLDNNKIFVAGADGYRINQKNYYANNLKNTTDYGDSFNFDVSKAIRNLKIDVKFITPSEYDV